MARPLIDEEDVNVGSLPGFGYGPLPERSTDSRFAPPAGRRAQCETTMARLVAARR